MSANELERDLAADMPLSDEDAEAVVGGAIVHTYLLKSGTSVSVDRRMFADGRCVFTFKLGSSSVGESKAKATVEAAGQRWIPTSTWTPASPPGGF